MIVTAKIAEIILNEQREMESIAQNVAIILSTWKGTVPLDREFGIPGELIDMPINLAKAKMSSEIIAAVEKYEPRAKVKRISYTFEEKNPGKLIPIVEVEKR